MKDRTKELARDFFTRNGDLEPLRESIFTACDLMVRSFSRGGKLLVCGNGGSCADGEHIVGELMKGFLLKRPLPDDVKGELRRRFGDEGDEMGKILQEALPAISLGSHAALMTAFANDADDRLVFAQQVMGYGSPGDVVLGISTSGNARNVCFALMASKIRGVDSIALTGENGGRLKEYADCWIAAPDERTFRVQEYHLQIYHFLCAFVESEMFHE